MKTLYKNVLLLDGKIVNWKTGEKHWDSLDSAFSNKQFVSLFELLDSGRLTVQSVSQEVHNTEENNAFFEDDEWYRQFPMHEEYKLHFHPYVVKE